MMPCHCSGLRHCLSFSGGNGSQDPATLDCPTSHSPACNNSSLSVKNGVSTSQQLKTPRYKGCRKIQSTLAVFIHLVGFLSVQCALCENISIHFLQSSPICAGYGRMKPFWKPFFPSTSHVGRDGGVLQNGAHPLSVQPGFFHAFRATFGLRRQEICGTTNSSLVISHQWEVDGG